MTCIILATPLVQKSRQPSNPTIGSLSFSSACGLVAVAGLPTNAHLEDVWLPGIFQKRRPPSSLESPSRKEAPKKLLRLIKHGVSFCIVFFGPTRKIPIPQNLAETQGSPIFLVFFWVESVPRFESKCSHTRMVRSCPAGIFPCLCRCPDLVKAQKRANLTFTFHWHPQRVNKTHISPTLYSRLRHGPRELFFCS